MCASVMQVRRRSSAKLIAVGAENEPIRSRTSRPPLPRHSEATGGVAFSMSQEELVDALRAIDGLVDVGVDPPNFQFRNRPFLHFHTSDEGTYADVRFGTGDFEPVWASTPQEGVELLARVTDHVESLNRSTRSNRGRLRRSRRR